MLLPILGEGSSYIYLLDKICEWITGTTDNNYSENHSLGLCIQSRNEMHKIDTPSWAFLSSGETGRASHSYPGSMHVQTSRSEPFGLVGEL